MLDVLYFLQKEFGNVREGSTDYKVDCHKCGGKGKLYVSKEREICHCFRCGYARNYINLVRDVLGCDFVTAYGELYVVPRPIDFGKELFEEYKEEPHPKGYYTQKLPHNFVGMWESGTSFAFKLVKKYARRRGLTDFLCQQYSIGYVPTIPLRLYLPVEGSHYQARAIGDSSAKYLSSLDSHPDMLANSKSLLLYDEVIITEGILSGIAVGDNHVALLGKKATPEQTVRLLSSTVRKFVVTVEPQAFSMLELADTLQAGGKEVEIWKYEYGDPAECEPSTQIPHNFYNTVNILLNS